MNMKECDWCRNIGNDYQTTRRHCPDGINDHRHLIFHGFSFGHFRYSICHCNLAYRHSLCVLLVVIMLKALLHSRLDAEFLSDMSLALGKNKPIKNK